MIPCPYRGEVWNSFPNRLCGRRGELEPVYRCELYTICTYRPYKHGQTERVCLRCEQQDSATKKPGD